MSSNEAAQHRHSIILHANFTNCKCTNVQIMWVDTDKGLSVLQQHYLVILIIKPRKSILVILDLLLILIQWLKVIRRLSSLNHDLKYEKSET